MEDLGTMIIDFSNTNNKPPIIFYCLDKNCPIFMYIPDNYSPCPVCCGMAVLVRNLSFQLWKPKDE